MSAASGRHRVPGGVPMRSAVGAVVLGAGLLGGCMVEQKRTVTSAMLAGLPGAETGVEVDLSNKRPAVNPQAAPADGLRVELPGGDVKLRARSCWHVMVHIYQTISKGERELFTEQVLSKRTQDEFIERGYDPAVAFDELVRRQRDVLRLFNAFPMGESTPGVFLESVGPNTFRIRARNPRGLRWSHMDVIIEDGEWRLRWFG